MITAENSSEEEGPEGEGGGGAAEAPETASVVKGIEDRAWFDSLVTFASPCLPGYGVRAEMGEGDSVCEDLPKGLKQDYEAAVRSALQAITRLADAVAPPKLPPFRINVSRFGRDS